MSIEPLNKRVWIWTGAAYLTSSIILYASIGANIECSCEDVQMQWKAFQRVGSLIVIIAILLGTLLVIFWYLPKKREVDRMTRELLQKTGSYVREAIPGAPQKVIDRITEEAVRDTESQLNAIREGIFGTAERNIAIAELLLIIIGTAIWGYGDLIPYLWGGC